MQWVLHSVYFRVLPWLMGFPKKPFVDFVGFVAKTVLSAGHVGRAGFRVDLRQGVVYLNE